MDAFPAYTKFDKTHKCLCALQIIGGDQDAAAEDKVECEPAEEKTYAITSVIAGYDEDIWQVEQGVWSQGQIEMIQKMTRNASTAINESDVDFYGTVLSGVNVDGLVAEEEQTGYYMPVSMNIATAGFIARVDKYGKFIAPAGQTAAATSFKFVEPIDQDVPVVTFAILSSIGTALDPEVEADAAKIAAGEYDIIEVDADGNKSYRTLGENVDTEFYSFDFTNLNFR